MNVEYVTPSLSPDERRYAIAGRFGQLLTMRAIGEDYCNGNRALGSINLKPLTDKCSKEEAALRICHSAFRNPHLLRSEVKGVLDAPRRLAGTEAPGTNLQLLGFATARNGNTYPLAEGVAPAMHLLDRYANNHAPTLAPKLWQAVETAMNMAPFFTDQARGRITEPGALPSVVESLARDYIFFVGDEPRPVEDVYLPRS